MAKKKLDWFKLDCQLDDKIKLIELEYGLKGFAIVVKLFQKIYGGEGYYCEWNEDVALMFAGECRVGVSVVSEIVAKAIKRGIFDKKMFEDFGVLTSHGIQTRYFEIASRRENKNLKTEYLLLCNTKNFKNVDNSSKNVDISEENADIFPQRRREKIREDEIRAEESRESIFSPAQIKTLSDEFGNDIVKTYAEKLENYIAQKRNGKHYADNVATVRRWIAEDINKGRLQMPKKHSYEISQIDQMQKDFMKKLMEENNDKDI